MVQSIKTVYYSHEFPKKTKTNICSLTFNYKNMFWYKLVKESNFLNTVQLAKWNIKSFKYHREEIIDLQRERIEEQSKVIDKLSKDIPWYLTAPIGNKNATDAMLKKNMLETLPKGYTEDMIYDFIIDRKQQKMVVLIK